MENDRKGLNCMEEKRLYKSSSNRILGGVCGGIAGYFGIDPTIVRLVWALFCLCAFAGVIAYIIAAVIIPNEP